MDIHTELLRAIHTGHMVLVVTGLWAVMYVLHRVLQHRDLVRAGEEDRRQYRQMHACPSPRDGQSTAVLDTPAGLSPPDP